MTNRDLEIFLAVVDCGKMSAAARKLFITQSSVSQAIASIEKEYGILLFDRLAHGLFLTEEGRDLAAHARALFAVQQDMKNFLETASRNRRLRVGATVTVGTCVIGPILRTVLEKAPGTQLEVEVTNTRRIEDMLMNSIIDVGLVEGRVVNPNIRFEPVIPDRLVLVFPRGHRFCGRESVCAADLEGEPLILREAGSGTRALFENQLLEKGVPPCVRWDCTNSETIKNAVAQGFGVSVISERLVRREVEAGLLCTCGIRDIELDRAFSVVLHKNKFITEELAAFTEACAQFARQEAAQVRE